MKSTFSSPMIEPLDARRLLAAIISPFRDYYATNSYSPRTINLRYYVSDPAVEGAVVDMRYDVGTVRVSLLSKTTPATVANFLKYVDNKRYDGTFVHRSVPGFVVQAGGYKLVNGQTLTVNKFPAVANEPGVSNLRGTLAMAKLGDQPNSATNEWFYNLTNNNATAGAKLDTQNGGFTVFGKVVGAGMTVVDNIAALPRQNFGQLFDEFPVKASYVSGNPVTKSDMVNLISVNRVSQVTGTTIAKVTATSNKPSLVSTKIASGKLILTYSRTNTGTASITVTAYGVDGSVTTDLFKVRVAAATTTQAVPSTQPPAALPAPTAPTPSKTKDESAIDLLTL